MSLLGGAPLGHKNYGEAESFLVKGYEGMNEREEEIPPNRAIRITVALNRLIEFYTATNKPEEIKKYSELRVTYPPSENPELIEKKWLFDQSSTT